MSSLTTLWRIGFVVILGFCLGSRAVAMDTVIPVSTATQLHEALANAQPGQTIMLADGVYTGEFTATTAGTALAPITLQGSSAAILQGPAQADGYVFHLDGADYWVLTGFTLRNALKGVVLDNANNNRLEHLLIERTGQEGVHFRHCSSYNILQASTISATGVITAAFGEGVYIGSDINKWATYSCDPDLRDKSHYNQILNNHFGPNVSAEAIDVKEGTVGGVILGNTFDATGLQGANYADSWIDVKGNRYKIGHNRGVQGGNTVLQHGFETHSKAGGWGRNNIFYANVFIMNSGGYGIHIDNAGENPGNTVCANNQVTGAGLGVTNIPVTGTSANHFQGIVIGSDIAVLPTVTLPTVQTIWLPLVNTAPCG
ncbi:MAG: coagulation factor 5/8 type domain-containing protein [Caldilineaceae bacterium]